MAKKAAKNPIQTMLDQIMELLKDRALSSQELVVLLDYPEAEILNSLKILLEKNKITITSQNKFKRTF
jgi:ATP-dependent DNA helicase RecQ